MKVNLIVAQGVHQGKQIPISVPEFIIGRDEKCQLRPASQVISKQHCAIIQRDGKVFIKDFGSTNGTFVNKSQISGEVLLNDQDYLQVGPLEFRIQIQVPVVQSDSKPSMPATPAKAAASQTVAASAKETVVSEAKTVAPAAKPAPKPVAATVDDSALNRDESKETDGQNSERLAALLLGMGDDDDTPSPTADGIPEGSTVMEMPGLNPTADAKKPAAKADDKVANSNVAADILKLYTQRRRT
ncbi:FHA domain-containing protein [Tuwongella immobilis]|uniref:FHA domain-containing protein n=1 Tax=Tuwongella immobilis TaxID=692036 RepID=A0A6C2YQK7_9BACT